MPIFSRLTRAKVQLGAVLRLIPILGLALAAGCSNPGALDVGQTEQATMLGGIGGNWWPPLPPPCGLEGNRCCEGPDTPVTRSAYGPLRQCDDGLGCDIVNDICVQPCGDAGQVCCDSLQTVALRWDANGDISAPLDPVWMPLLPMCSGGACDKASHRCIACGSTDGASCCPPEPEQAYASCTAPNLDCQFDTWTSGVCHTCGLLGTPPCYGSVCDFPLDVRNGVCDYCGGAGQPPCDYTYNTGCNDGLVVHNGVCDYCGDAGQPPCDYYGCKGDLVRNYLQICSHCGDANEPCCAGNVCGDSTRTFCETAIDTTMPTAVPVCASCGHYDEFCCPGKTGKQDTCTEQGTSCIANWTGATFCGTPSPPPPPPCGHEGEACCLTGPACVESCHFCNTETPTRKCQIDLGYCSPNTTTGVHIEDDGKGLAVNPGTIHPSDTVELQWETCNKGNQTSTAFQSSVKVDDIENTTVYEPALMAGGCNVHQVGVGSYPVGAHKFEIDLDSNHASGQTQSYTDNLLVNTVNVIADP
jgi:hypothetical protein